VFEKGLVGPLRTGANSFAMCRDEVERKQIDILYIVISL
jgi:hypothetical protein